MFHKVCFRDCRGSAATAPSLYEYLHDSMTKWGPDPGFELSNMHRRLPLTIVNLAATILTVLPP
jgi:hypothetical protein